MSQDQAAPAEYTAPAAQSEHSEHPEVLWTQEFWDERYSTADRIWSGNPNPQLVAQVGNLTPGTALDVGCGEGADAIWLAAQGWQVTGVDVSTVALARAAGEAARVGAEVAARIRWQQVDIRTWDPAPQQFDLISSQFMHLPSEQREALNRRMAAAIRRGGTLLIVGHHPSDLDTTMGRPNFHDMMFTAEQVAATLDPADWQIVEASSPSRSATDPAGEPVTIHDAVLRAVRRR